MGGEKEIRRRGRGTKVGHVISQSMDKSIVVAVDRLVEHPLYGKTIRRTSKFMAHDEQNECSVGDQVRISSSRPLSKRKRWVVLEILEKAKE